MGVIRALKKGVTKHNNSFFIFILLQEYTAYKMTYTSYKLLSFFLFVRTPPHIIIIISVIGKIVVSKISDMILK